MDWQVGEEVVIKNPFTKTTAIITEITPKGIIKTNTVWSFDRNGYSLWRYRGRMFKYTQEFKDEIKKDRLVKTLKLARYDVMSLETLIKLSEIIVKEKNRGNSKL